MSPAKGIQYVCMYVGMYVYVCMYVCMYICMLPISCPVYNFVIPGWILKLLGRNVNHYETVCPVQDTGQ